MGIREVASLASVSTATVSRVITGAVKVSSTTRERVLRAMQALNFRPNEAARTLALAKKHKDNPAISPAATRILPGHSESQDNPLEGDLP